ncbi:PREDICTED: sugar transport protein 2 [Brassica oleracea var. oleracea]|uniref:Major facilitator superfamily (MFS) profile domain-containing protein n=1 Tax=Brassica oleracea var. oleracea TaxID=109376 RepID=A0A0D3C897_BRAOL|nr:PREDICTED: sugar transport protein 2 [Brassica oleracea var. oleracea]
MAVGVMDIEGGGASLPGKTTFQVVMCSIIAAVGGLMFGYDIGISGGVTSMDTFLLDFFPHVYEKKHRVHENNYCKFDDQLLQLFTSSLYLAGIFASFAASFLCRRFGRKPVIMSASIFFLLGAILNYFARDLGMLIGGRILLGFGIGFGNQTVPLFISEIAPPRIRGGLNIAFQLLITIGILAASFVNYLTSTMKNGWRYSLGGAAVPALILLIGSFFIHETPASLIERGKDEEGKKVLRKIRGIDNIELEFNEIKRATEISNKVKTPFKELFTKSENRPPLVCGTLLQFFQQFTGINVVMFYAPVLFQTMGSGNNASLVSTVVTNGVNALATVFAVIMVDRLGRKFFLVEGATQMMATQITIGALLLKYLHLVGPITSHAVPLIVLILICIYVSGFAWSWGPLGWLIPSEIYQLEVRTSGYFCAVAMNMVCTFVIGQFFLSALCRFRSGLFFFFAVMNVIMGLFAIFFLPETRGVPIEDMAEQRWKKHWHWKKYFKQN